MISKDLGTFKTECSISIDKISDIDLAYKTYYILNRNPIDIAVKDLLESKGIRHDGLDYHFLIDQFFFDVGQKKWDYEILDDIRRISSGDYFNQEFLIESKDQVKNFRDYIDIRISDCSLNKIVNYKPSDWPGASIGRGEFAFIIFGNDVKKAKSGGDLNINGKEIEIKGIEAGLYSQNTHNSAMGIAKQFEMQLGVKPLPPISKKQIEEFYLPKLGNEGLKSFLTEFSKFIMPNIDEKELEWYNSRDFDYDYWINNQALTEFNYYKKETGINSIIFLNNENLNFINIEEMTIDKLKNFNIKASYRFYINRITTLKWELK